MFETKEPKHCCPSIISERQDESQAKLLTKSEQAQIEVFRISIFYSDEDVSCLAQWRPLLSSLQNMNKKPISELPKTDKTRIELESKSAKESILSSGTGKNPFHYGPEKCPGFIHYQMKPLIIDLN